MGSKKVVSVVANVSAYVRNKPCFPGSNKIKLKIILPSEAII